MRWTWKKITVAVLLVLGLCGACGDDFQEIDDASDPAEEQVVGKSEAPELSGEEQAAQEILDEQTPEPEPEPEPEKTATPESQPEPPTETAAPVKQTPAPAEMKSETSAETKPQSRTVYVTMSGKRYHYSNSCNGGTYYESTLDAAQARGLTPCQKCT